MDDASLERAHAENYERSKKMEPLTLTARELYDKLGEVIAEGNGARPCFFMQTEGGFTVTVPIGACFSSQPYDGEVVWIIEEV